jgi:hypothetical protein
LRPDLLATQPPFTLKVWVRIATLFLESLVFAIQLCLFAAFLAVVLCLVSFLLVGSGAIAAAIIILLPAF